MDETLAAFNEFLLLLPLPLLLVEMNDDDDNFFSCKIDDEKTFPIRSRSRPRVKRKNMIFLSPPVLVAAVVVVFYLILMT
jgi:hypothetical protein